MKFTIAKRDLLATLKFARNVVERKNTIPILGNVLLTARDNLLRVKFTDLDVEVEASIACEVADAGATTVPATMLNNIVDKMKQDSDIKVEQENVDNAPLKVSAGRSRFTLQSLPAQDFPDLTIQDVAHSFELPVAQLADILTRTEFCISTEETRYYLNGVFFHHIKLGDKVRLRGCSTDGHRLAQIEDDAPEGAQRFDSANNPTGVILPKKTCKLLSAILKEGGIDKVTVNLNQTKAVFVLGGITVNSKLIDGTFPDYARVVPQGNDKTMRADRAELIEVIDRLATVTGAGMRAVKLSLATGTLTLSVSNPEAGAATETMDVEYDGEALDVGFNATYLKDILDNVEGEQVQFKLADPGSPALIQGDDADAALFVQMPMRV